MPPLGMLSCCEADPSRKGHAQRQCRLSQLETGVDSFTDFLYVYLTTSSLRIALDFSKIESGRLELEHETLAPARVR